MMEAPPDLSGEYDGAKKPDGLAVGDGEDGEGRRRSSGS